MKRILLLVTAIASLSYAVQAQNVNIPDAIFKAYLVGNAAINTNLDSEIQVSEATAFSGMIDCSFYGITDLMGIEAFTNLDILECNHNSLSGTLDLSSNTALTFLNCTANDLTGLELSQNTDLVFLEFTYNSITDIDLSQNTALTQLWCGDNGLTSL